MPSTYVLELTSAASVDCQKLSDEKAIVQRKVHIIMFGDIEDRCLSGISPLPAGEPFLSLASV